MVKFENILRADNSRYLEKRPDFTKQLLITLNQLSYDPYSIYFKINNEQKHTLVIYWNKNFSIRSLNPEHLLQTTYYEKLTLLKNNRLINWQTTYYPNELLIEKCTLNYTLDNYQLITIDIKLDQPINMYHDQQVKVIGSFIDNIIKLICKNRFSVINPNLFINNCLNQYYNSKESHLMITFNLKDFANPLIEGNVNDETMRNTEFIRDKLKDVLKPKSKLFKYLETYNLVDQLKSLK